MDETNLLDSFLSALQAVNRYARRGAFPQSGQQLTRVQWMLLRHLRKTGQTSIGQLADFMNVRPSTMSQMLDRLEKESWVQRETDSHDSRVRNVRLTEDGLALIHSIESAWHERMLVPFSSLTRVEQNTLVDLMTKLAGAAQRLTHTDPSAE